MLKVTNGNGRPMSGKRLNNFGGKNPQKQSNMFTEPKYQRLQSNRYGAMETNAAESPQKQKNRRKSVNQTKSPLKLQSANRLFNVAK